MLVLSRKSGERLLIGDHIEVIVVGIKGGRVQLGINAPTSISIRRGELKPRVEPQLPAEFQGSVPVAVTLST